MTSKTNILDNFNLNIEYDLSDLIKKINVSNKYTIFVFEYGYGLIDTKFYVIDDLNMCFKFINHRYVKFDKEKNYYKHIEEEYFDESSYVHIMTAYGPDDNNNVFATKIQICGVNKNDYKKLKKEIKKIFGDYLFFF
jgi:hypothetical protein